MRGQGSATLVRPQADRRGRAQAHHQRRRVRQGDPHRGGPPEEGGPPHQREPQPLPLRRRPGVQDAGRPRPRAAGDLRDAGPGRQGEDPRGRIPHPRMRRHLGGQGQPRGMRLCAAANGRGQGPDLPAIACELLDECLTADPQKTCGRGADNMTLVLVQLRDTIPPIRPSKRRAPAQSCFGAQAD
ncbi:unnamed protein product [Prorocentrum cordatum]|uniref:Protein-serine/threonine phosphatase n=1 Tax=Prorocentrum cordatum TaxID=2364126 RepID=A0ABN9YH05_9DINO|nr:unnamed protein product [Polarella glacialis]